MAWNITADMRRFGEALAAFRRRVVMTPAAVRAMHVKGRQQAFWIAGAAQLNIVQEVVDQLDNAMAKGLPFSAFKKKMGETLARAWGKANPARVETIARNAIQRAYNVGRVRQMDEPAVKAFRPYRMFDAVLDSRTSTICKRLDQTILPADDPFWASHVPPLHHRCRSGIRSLRASEAQRRGIAPAAPSEKPQGGFGQAPGQLWKPDLKVVDSELGKELRRKAAANDNR